MKLQFVKGLSVVLALSTAVPALAAEVDKREAVQQQRINQGVRSGELTPREANRLERKEAKVNREIARDRAMNGGTLTPAERRKINREENRNSRAIYRQKHDAQVVR
jgi:hypothetical protein